MSKFVQISHVFSNSQSYLAYEVHIVNINRS